jgi:hypothetical protein
MTPMAFQFANATSIHVSWKTADVTGHYRDHHQKKTPPNDLLTIRIKFLGIECQDEGLPRITILQHGL